MDNTEELMRSGTDNLSFLKHFPALAILLLATVAGAQTLPSTAADTTATQQTIATTPADAPAMPATTATATTTTTTVETAAGDGAVAVETSAPAAAPGGMQVSSHPARAPYWAPLGGFETDTHKEGYGFIGPSYVHPFSSSMAWTAQAFGNYLYYQFQGSGGTHRIQSPGASFQAGLRFGDKNWFQLQAGPSFKRRHTAIVNPASGAVVSSIDENRMGVDGGADVYLNPTSRNNVMGMVNYGSADHYTWSSVVFKQQISNFNWHGRFTHYLGAEFVAQGNKDVTSRQIGAVFELLHAPSSLSIDFSAGWKVSTFAIGPRETGPWFAIGFWQRLK